MNAEHKNFDAGMDAKNRQKQRPPGGPKLIDVFDPRANALNAWRLILAAGVILQHSWPLTGRKEHPPYDQLLSQVWVDGFFVISGFLITSSWIRNPRLREYVAARALRIFPGLWVCLAVVAFVIAPIGVAIQGGSAAKLLASTAPIEYVLNNAVLNVYHAGIAGTPTGVPWPGVWDGPLWTLIFELMCYIAVALAGLAGLLKRRWPAVAVFVLAVAVAALVSYPVNALETLPQMVSRFAVVFAAGAVLRQYQDRIPARWSLVALSAVIVIAAGMLVPNYRVIAAIPLAYAVVVSGALIKTALEVAQRFVLWHLYLCVAGSAVAGHLRTSVPEPVRIRGGCGRRYGAAGRTELVSCRETRDGFEIAPPGQGQAARRRPPRPTTGRGSFLSLLAWPRMS